MSQMPAVVVRKGGFLSPLFHGVFGFLTVVVVCATGLGVYGLHVANSKVGEVLNLTGRVVSGFPEWEANLPPLLADALNDHRAPDYRDQIEVSVRTVPAPRDRDREFAVVEVRNKGSETVTMLALTVVLEDEDGVPYREIRTYAATPFSFDDDEWRGPLLPDSTRQFTVSRYGHDGKLRAIAEIVDLRVWNGPQTAPRAAATADGKDETAGATTRLN